MSESILCAIQLTRSVHFVCSSENGKPSMENIIQGRFFFTDKLRSDEHSRGSRRPSRLSLDNVSSWPQAVVVNDGRCTPMIESLIKNRFIAEGNNPMQRPFRHPQALDEQGVPMIESTIKGRWYVPPLEGLAGPKHDRSRDWIAINKVCERK